MGPSCNCRGSSRVFPSVRQPRSPATELRKYVHATVISPFSTQLPSDASSTGLDPEFLDRPEGPTHPHDDDGNKEPADSNDLIRLCDLLETTPADLLRFESTPDGVRGVYLNHGVNEGDIILSLPLESCLQDDKPPAWLQNIDDEDKLSSNYNPSNWATRLGASLLDLQLRQRQEGDKDIGQGHVFWLSLLPDPEFLRASLPVHWPEETVQNARSTALELAVDSSYFARAEAVEELVYTLKSNSNLTASDLSDDELRQLCSNALDVVQTRACRLWNDKDDTPLRVLAPIFDFFNHGSIKVRGDAGANARFQLEDDQTLIVRAVKSIQANEEVLIDYGDSARPAWRCLHSYGFVPQYNQIPGPNEEATADSEDEDEDEDEDNEAEVYMDGVRYVVGPSQVPFDMVATAFSSDHPVAEDEEDVEVSLTPEIALKLADRISDVAYYLLLEPEEDLHDDLPAATASPFQVISSRLAASLRWSQHRILMACALGLREFAADATSFL